MTAILELNETKITAKDVVEKGLAKEYSAYDVYRIEHDDTTEYKLVLKSRHHPLKPLVIIDANGFATYNKNGLPLSEIEEEILKLALKKTGIKIVKKTKKKK